ncbi:MAG: zinc ribbon domain-containing protein [Clostridiales bacterium]|nr:zinc ribbon domain-containing protein [Clostridiales bacterium]
MAFCNNCGVELGDSAKFCAACGKAVGVNSSRSNGGTTSSSGQDAFESIRNMATNTADETDGMDAADIEKNKVMGGLAYFLFFLPLIACPDSKYGRFHANQGLMFLFLCLAGSITARIITGIFLAITWRLLWLTSIISLIIWLPILAIGVIGLINGFSGKAKELPFIGQFRIIK